MILWSTVPAEIVFGNVDPMTDYEEIEYSGTKCLVEKINSRQCKVVRLLTTNPSDYLCTELQPGAVLTYEPIVKSLS